MIKKIISSLAIILSLASSPVSIASANTSLVDTALAVTDNLSFDSAFNWSQQFSVKKNVPYDESKDSALRRGTENWDQPQGSFFVMPAFIFGLILVFLYFNREK
ncbi:hypothetical protein [Crenothrix sp.]|uniref:hypothetical protein n=1 Tax=Crenothrix sp. TaxID=3100433 RepID=UPI00374D1964